MEKYIYENYLKILKGELTVALGCTEPIAIAYAGAKVREVLGEMPQHCEVFCSGNIVKNVKGVTVPNSGGLKGIDVAAVLGIVGGDAKKKLAVLEGVTEEERQTAKELVSSDFCICHLVENVENLYILVRAYVGEHEAEVEIKDYHINITKIKKDGELWFDKKEKQGQQKIFSCDKSLLNIKGILEFASEVNIKDVEETLERQIHYNSKIAEEGLKNSYGAQVGRTLLMDFDAENVKLKAKAYAAAGSDARMSGCPLPVVINSGSGNQGITVSMPVIQYAKAYKKTREELLRALVVSNLTAIHQKKYIGNLSAYCGAVSAAAGSGAGIAWLLGAGYDEIGNVITDTIANIGGMVCDGAKPSCAAKIALAVEAAVLAVHMGMKNRVFQCGEGLVKEDVEATIRSIGRMGKKGMKSTDVEILNIMLEK
ncbi:MAG: serine dehydratase subunit alpha family protein [Clostridium sp.]|nr:serine dehydratase subunit alpha family protein [Clostridium sp.]